MLMTFDADFDCLTPRKIGPKKIFKQACEPFKGFSTLTKKRKLLTPQVTRATQRFIELEGNETPAW